MFYNSCTNTHHDVTALEGNGLFKIQKIKSRKITRLFLQMKNYLN